ncbi:MAG: hypothetical protein LC789_01495 [Actinobacteria bacterium]|nr:hypothetical protein [Actinomycetota bacterium]
MDRFIVTAPTAGSCESSTSLLAGTEASTPSTMSRRVPTVPPSRCTAEATAAAPARPLTITRWAASPTVLSAGSRCAAVVHALPSLRCAVLVHALPRPPAEAAVDMASAAARPSPTTAAARGRPKPVAHSDVEVIDYLQ